MQLKITPPEKMHWTQHSKGKMRYWRLSERRVKRVLKNYDRRDLGIAPNTVAVMEIVGTKKRPTEIWAMYQKTPKNSKTKQRTIKIISAWRYPGRSPRGQPPPIPEDTLWELEKSKNENKTPA